MFWRSVGLSHASPIEALLDKSDVTLEELLDDDGIIQECKSLNARLINFLSEKKVVEKLVRYLINMPAPDGPKEFSARYSYVCCEIFTCEVEAVYNTMLDDNGQLFNLLFDFLENDAPLNSLLAGYFSKVVVFLLARRGPQCSAILQKRPGIIARLVHHVGATSIAEVILRLINPIDPSVSAQSLQTQRWFADSTLMSSLVARMAPSYPSAVQANVAEILAGVARTAPCLLAQQLTSPTHLQDLFAHGLAPGNSKGLLYVLDVAIAIVDPKVPGAEEGGVEPSRVVGVFLPHIASLTAKLSLKGQEGAQPTPWGELRPPLGQVRLKVVDFFVTMLRTHSPPVTENIMRQGVFSQCLDLFFAFPFNNFLHHLVEGMVLFALSSGEELRRHVIITCDLPTRLATSPVSVQSGGWAKAKTLRRGNLGHVARMANRLLDLAGAGGWVEETLWANERWGQWVNSYLKDRNEIEGLNKWLCGRPSALGTGNNSDDDLSKDFDMSAMSSSLGLSRDVYNRYGSSGGADDDWDDDDGGDGDGAGGFRSAALLTTRAEDDDDDDDDDDDGDGAEGGGQAQEIYTSWEERSDGTIDFSKLLVSAGANPNSLPGSTAAALAAAAASAGGSGGGDGDGGGAYSFHGDGPSGGAERDAGDGDRDESPPAPEDRYTGGGAGDDDEVILVGYDDDPDPDIPIDGIGSPTTGAGGGGDGSSPPFPGSPSSPSRGGGGAGAGAGKGAAGGKEEDSAMAFSSFAFWRKSYDLTLVPDDL